MARGAWLLCAVLLAGPVGAQVSGSVAVVSDYRYRGASLSDGDPTALASIAWDGANGWYAGAQVAHVRLYGEGGVQLLPYAGYVRRIGHGLAVEGGVQYSWFSVGDEGYVEAYAGLGGEHLRGRVFFAPDYFDAGEAWYVEAEGDRPLGQRLRALAHAGALHLSPGTRYPGLEGGWRADFAVGLGLAVAGFDLQASWVGGEDDDPGGYCSPWQCGAGSGWVLRVARDW